MQLQGAVLAPMAAPSTDATEPATGLSLRGTAPSVSVRLSTISKQQAVSSVLRFLPLRRHLCPARHQRPWVRTRMHDKGRLTTTTSKTDVGACRKTGGRFSSDLIWSRTTWGFCCSGSECGVALLAAKLLRPHLTCGGANTNHRTRYLHRHPPRSPAPQLQISGGV